MFGGALSIRKVQGHMGRLLRVCDRSGCSPTVLQTQRPRVQINSEQGFGLQFILLFLSNIREFEMTRLFSPYDKSEIEMWLCLRANE